MIRDSKGSKKGLKLIGFLKKHITTCVCYFWRKHIRTVLLDDLMRTFEYDPFSIGMNKKRSATKWSQLFCKNSIAFLDKWSLHFDTKPRASYLTLPAKCFRPKKFAEPPLAKVLIEFMYNWRWRVILIRLKIVAGVNRQYSFCL